MDKDEIKRLLPAIYQQTATEGSFLDRVLDMMVALLEPSERTLDDLDTYFDPYRASDPFVTYLAGWFGLEQVYRLQQDLPDSLPITPLLLRHLISQAADLYRWRGTPSGLTRFLTLATGVRGFVVSETVTGADGAVIPFHIRVYVPQAADNPPTMRLIADIVKSQKPVYITCDIVVGTPPDGASPEE